MLVLSRKQDESIIVNGDIEIIITGISGNKVSVGIVAPSNVTIFRKELCSATEEKRTPKRASKAPEKKSLWNVFRTTKSLNSSVR